MTSENRNQVGEKTSSALETFKKRALSTIILIALLLTIYLVNNPYLYLGFVTILSLITAIEWVQMLKQTKIKACPLLIIAGSIVYPILIGLVQQNDNPGFSFIKTLSIIALAPAIISILAFTWELRKPVEGQQSVMNVATNIISFIYPNWMFLFCLPLLISADIKAINLLIWIIAVTKVMDMGAYISGSLFGKHKMIPHISPKKTWEGFIGACIITTLVGTLSVYFLGDNMNTLSHWSLFGVAVFSLGLGLISVIGDLAGSFIKRALGVKDSGKILPGIGGVFDLIDSPAFTLPIALIFISLF